MKNKRDAVFLGTVLAVQVLVFALILFSTHELTDRIYDHTQTASKEQSLQLSEDRMKERIENTFIMIESERERTLSSVSELGNVVVAHMGPEPAEDLEDHVANLQASFSESLYGQAVQMLIHNQDTGTVMLFNNGLGEDVTDRFGTVQALEDFVRNCPYRQRVPKGAKTLYVFAAQEDLDAISKSNIHDMIHQTQYGEEGYIWVNEVLNYDGGDGYAIRRIHPYFKDMEGGYLTTNSMDAAGQCPYKNELEGIKENGEIFHTYYLEMKDGQAKEKASYARLYQPFDWIVATGDPMDAIFAYAAEQEAYSNRVFTQALQSIAAAFAVLFLVDVAVIVVSNRRRKQKAEVEAEKRANETKQLFDIVAQHSNRVLYEFDLASGTTRIWNEADRDADIMAHLYAGNYSETSVEQNQYLLPDCLDAVKAFFDEIYAGVPSGSVNVHLKLLDGEQKWYHFRYSTIFENETPKSALISVEDRTEHHDQALSYLRYTQTKGNEQEKHLLEIECDLTEDQIESLSGQILSEEERGTRGAYSALRRGLLNLKFRYEDFAESAKYFSCEHLLELYAQGERKLSQDWKVRFNDFSVHWLSTEVVLVEDPYNNHIKASICMWDVTEERDEQQAMLHRADYDVMTGLLRKDVGEARIKKQLEAKNNKGGILIALDLDDLKKINDVLGHRQGDRAIVGIAKTLKSHFRKDDILVRAGGDEFIVFLPGAGKSIRAVERSVSILQRRLSELSVGENDEQQIHCSIGCAIEIPGQDTFDTLFNRADKALYHVKRSGKNNFAFYIPEMEQADYKFRAKTFLGNRDEKKFDLPEVQYLLESIIRFYQLVLSVNVSKNTYHMMEEVESGVFASLPAFGSLDGFVEMASKLIHADDVQEYFGKVSRGALVETYERGKMSVRHLFRFLHQGEYRWAECLVVFYVNERKELCDFTLLRWADELHEAPEGATQL